MTVAALALGHPAVARGAPDTHALKRFSVPAQCGNESAFAQAIRERVGKDAELLLGALELSIDGNVEGFALSMRVGDEARNLFDRHCEDLFRAAVVVAVALWEAPHTAESASSAVNPSVPPNAAPEISPDPRSPAERAPVNTGTVTPPHGQVVPHAKTRARPPFRAWLQGEAGVLSGLTPDPTPTFGLRGALEQPRFGMATGVRLLLPSSDRDKNDRGVSVFAIGAHVSAFARPLPPLGVELGASAHLLRGRGLGSHATDTAVLGSFGPRLGLWAIPIQTNDLLLTIGVEGQLAVIRPSFEISEYGRVFRADVMSAGGFLTLGYRIF
jgi:hypothetical protein